MADLVTLDQVLAHLNLSDHPPSDVAELELFIRAATEHVAYHYATFVAAPPADLILAALEDIRGLYQPGQIGPPGSFGSFDIDPEPSGFRPVIQWPRLDAWVRARTGSQIA